MNDTITDDVSAVQLADGRLYLADPDGWLKGTSAEIRP